MIASQEIYELARSGQLTDDLDAIGEKFARIQALTTTADMTPSLAYRLHQFLSAQQSRYNHHIHELHCRQAAHWRCETPGAWPECNCEVGRLIEEMELAMSAAALLAAEQ